jgi:hypothetical protein
VTPAAIIAAYVEVGLIELAGLVALWFIARRLP